MKLNTKRRRKSIEGFKNISGRKELLDQMYQIFCKGKVCLYAFLLDLGRTMAETIMYIEQEEISGSEYCAISPDIQKWASQGYQYILEIKRCLLSIHVSGVYKERSHYKAARS